MWLINIDEPSDLAGNSILVNYEKRALYNFRHQSYLRDYGALPLKVKIRELLDNLGAKLIGNETIYLLGQLNNLGLYFSPLNLYFVITGDRCSHILAEVSNTPWNERHYYLLDKEQKHIISPKKFHVSPFFGLNQEYHWDFNIRKDRINFRIDTYENEKNVFSAGFSGNLIGVKDKKFKLSVIKSPLNVYKIFAGIYFEAFRLWLKRIPFVAHPFQKK